MAAARPGSSSINVGRATARPADSAKRGQEHTLPVTRQSLRPLGGGQLERIEQTHIDLGHYPARVRTSGRDKARDDI